MIPFKERTYEPRTFYLDEIELINNELKINPKDPELFNIKGVLHLKLKDYKEAISNFDKALNLKRKAEYFNSKGYALTEQNIFDDANKCYEEAINLDPFNRDYVYYKEINLINQKLFKNCFDCVLLNEKGKYLFRLAFYETALAYFNESIFFNPDNSDYHFNKAITLIELNDWDSSITSLNDAIKLNPNNPIYELYKEINSLNRLINEEPNNTEANKKKQICLKKIKEFEKTFHSKEAIVLNPEIENLKKSVTNALKEEQKINKKGVEHLELFEFKEALDCFDKSICLNPANDEFYFNKAIALTELYKTKEANDCLNKAVSMNPMNSEKFKVF